MSKRKKDEMGEMYKHLYEWSDERLSFDKSSRFRQFYQLEGYDSMDMFSETDFLVLLNKFEA